MREALEGGREGEREVKVPRVWKPCREEHTGQAGFTSFPLLMSDWELSNLGGREGGREAAHQVSAECALLSWG